MTSRIERVAISEVVVDGRVQRGLDLGRVDRMAKAWDWDAFGVPTLSRRADGSMHAVDGQHRVMGARAAGFHDRKPQFKVHEGLSLQDEAKLFRLLNNTRKPMPVDLFRVAVIEEDPAAVEMNKLIEHVGLYVAASGERAFRAVTALRQVHEGDPVAAMRALDVLTRSWGSSANSVPASLVAGAGKFFLRYGDQVNSDQLIRRLGKYGGGANAFVGASRGLAKIRGVGMPDAVADVLVTTYNKIPRVNKLADWSVVG